MQIQTLLIHFPVGEEWLARLTEKLPDTEILLRGNTAPLTQEDVARADVIFGNVPAKMLQDAGRLQWLHLASAGTDGYTFITERGVLLTNGTGAYNDTIAEHMLALTSALCIQLPAYIRQQQARQWQRAGWSTYLMDSTVLILGCGSIGCAYARRMKALGAHTIGVRRSPGPAPEGVDEMYTMEQLDSLLPRADVVAMVMPNTPETENAMDARRIALMKDGAMLLNVGRGNALEPNALYDGLVSGKLSGAAIDVAYTEPLPPDDRLWDAPNLLITPHVAGGWNLANLTTSPAMADRVCRVFLENLEQYLADAPLPNAVDPRTGYTKTQH